MDKTYKISIGSAINYNNIIADIKFKSILGIIISQEVAGVYEASVYSLTERPIDKYADCLNIPADKILAIDLIEAVKIAIEKLQDLG